MKKLLTLLLTLLAADICAAEKPLIRIHTDQTDLLYRIDDQGRLCQSYLGPAFRNPEDLRLLPAGDEAFTTYGSKNYFTPALRLTHNDGNGSLQLAYVSHETRSAADGVTETSILLRDEAYPVEVKLILTAFERENVIKSRTEIVHYERKPVTLYEYASSMLRLGAGSYYLTEFTGDWAHEVNKSERRLDFGKKVLDSSLGSRANMFCPPLFAVTLDGPMSETEGEVLLGTLAWTGNFRFTFEVDQNNGLRILSGINPFASEYSLRPREIFRTPEFIFTFSTGGAGSASRSLHDWARRHQLKDGGKDRMTLLNNWEATYFDFNEEKLAALMDDAAELGVDMFLLDDGWFGNKHPRHNDTQGLGDWDETRGKLPGGIAGLVETAEGKGIRFGLWIEPEMVNPRSELYEKHRDWVLRYPNRDEAYFRNQLVLDLANPEVQDFVFGVVDRLMTENPGIAYFKWDCNSPITNVYSPYLKEKQNQLYIDHVRGVYNVFKRVAEKYPHLPIMLCSGGGARCDYEALKYFTEFWCSDNTDPIERLYIQWGFSQFFPAKAMCAHVTSWNKNTSIKFRTDVAMMCKMGFDISLKEMNDDEMKYCQEAVANYKRLKGTILDGDLYRLVSPYDTNHSSVMYVDKAKSKSVLFAYDIHPRFGEKTFPVKLQGLDPNKKYKVQEINLMPGQKSTLVTDGGTFSGDFLMKIGMNVFSTAHAHSKVIELTEAH